MIGILKEMVAKTGYLWLPVAIAASVAMGGVLALVHLEARMPKANRPQLNGVKYESVGHKWEPPVSHWQITASPQKTSRVNGDRPGGSVVIRSDEPASPRPKSIGIYVSNSPDDPAATTVIDWVSQAGFDTVYNYSSIDGSPAQITAYLDYAQRRGIKVIISLKDLYDQLPNGAKTAADHTQFGGTNAAIAASVVRQFGNHPAVWGFGLTDEAPEAPAQLASWRPILDERYRQLKAITNKPMMAVLVGWSDGQATERQSFLSSLRGVSDRLALDYYPIPFLPTARINTIATDMRQVGENDGWFIMQAFNWNKYADTARGLGFNINQARYPTEEEMIHMGRAALNSGASNLLFYSYFDLASPSEREVVKAAVTALKNDL